MLEFSPINAGNRDRVYRAYRNGTYRISDYSLGMKLMWNTYLHPEVAFTNGCMVVRNRFRGAVRFEYPIPCEEGSNLPGALLAMERYCMETYIPLHFCSVPPEQLSELVSRYRTVRIQSSVFDDEYIYQAEDLAQFRGKHYAGQRNHIHQFQSAYPSAVWKVLTPDDRPRLRRFFERFSYHSPHKGREAADELKRAADLLMREDLSWACAGYMEYEGEIIAVSLGEICGDTMIIHIEKALHEYEGVYPATVQAFASCFCKDVRFINREEDAGDEGLRRSKVQYRATCMQPKYSVCVQSELASWRRIPALSTERLTLSALCEEDKAAYNRLCLDDRRNRYWGYDYRSDCPEPDENYFLEVTRRDFRSRTAVNWGIRAGGRLVGEVLLYDFDYHGGAQIGIRLLEGQEGQGFAGEALAAILHQGLYALGLSVIYAKCYRENAKSFKLLSGHMQKVREDDTFIYFESRI
jgi:hypothetical protein